MSVVRFLVISVILLLLFSLLYPVQRHLEELGRQERAPDTFLYLPSGRYVNAAALGFDELLADILWMRAVVYFGQQYVTTRNYEWLFHMIDMVTTLDPLYKIAYQFGGVILAWEVKNVEKSNIILERGMKNFPDYWFFPWHLGFNYLFFLDKPDLALNYLEQALRLPRHPGYLASLVGRLHQKTGKREIALKFLVEGYPDAITDTVKEVYIQRLKDLLPERDYLSLVSQVEHYKQEHGSYPKEIKPYFRPELLRGIEQ